MNYQTVQQWENDPPDTANPDRKSTAPKRTRMPLVAAVLGVTESYLATGEDDGSIPLDPAEGRLLTLYRELPEGARKLLVEQAAGLHTVMRAPPKPKK